MQQENARTVREPGSTMPIKKHHHYTGPRTTRLNKIIKIKITIIIINQY
jgi:hypothetical protein